MEKMKTYEITIEGSVDMLQNKLSRELNKEIKEVEKDKKEEWEEKNWQRKLYKKGNEIVIPELVLHSFLKEACMKYKVSPPKSIGRTWTNYFKSAVIPLEPAILTNVKIEPFGAMVNGNPSQQSGKSSRVYRIRPLIKKGWATKIKLVDTQGYLTEKLVFDIISTGGLFVGIGDWRPLYGRFIVKSVNEVD